MNTPTITSELKSAVKAVLIAKAYTETIRPTIEKIKKDALMSKVFMIAERWTNHPSGRNAEVKRIIEPKEAYLLNDEDANEYFALCHAAYIAAGFNVPAFGYCPLLMAENTEREALRIMVEASKYIVAPLGLGEAEMKRMTYKLEWIRQYEKTTISMVCAQYKDEFTAANLLAA
jgi:hypothetical protein